MSFIEEDNSEEESLLVVRKKKGAGILIESEDEDFISSSSREMSDVVISESPSPRNSSNFSKSTIITSTPSKVIDDSRDISRYNEGQSFKTPRNEIIISSSDTDDDHDDIISSDSDVIDGSREDISLKQNGFNLSTPQTVKSKTPRHGLGRIQPTLDSYVKKLTFNDHPKSDNISSSPPQDDQIKCKRSDYNQQLEKIRQYEQEMMKTKNHLSTIKLSVLPDKGELLKAKFETCKNNFLSAQDRLRKMIVIEEDHPEVLTGKALVTRNWTNLEAGIASVQPKTFGKKGLENYNIQKALTVERLEQLHGSLENCPTDNHFAEDPKGLKVELMSHQKRALAWLEYRESQKPPGGILADDMGLGKTLTMIALILKTKSHVCEDNENEDKNESADKKHRKHKGGTLVVCPASLLFQWSGEIDSKLKRGLLSYLIYHGPKRESKPKNLAQYDVVITTYSLVMNESEKNSTLCRVKWKRIILDEAHQIRNHKSLTSLACCELASKYRWALTGTPVHNKELDMYALLKFLRCTPFDDLTVWKRWVSDKSVGGGERLHTVISSLMLRRTKGELIENGTLTTLPSRKWESIEITLDTSEMGIYQKILIFSQTLFAQFLHQKAEKNQEYVNLKNPNADPNSEYVKMRQKLLKLNKLKEVNQHEILVLLLRLRQICCHPSLIINMLHGDEDLGENEHEESEEMNILEQLNKLNLNENESSDNSSLYTLGLSEKGVGIKEATKSILNPSHPIFSKDRKSSKIRTIMTMIPNILSAGDKIIIVSQWKSYLELIGIHLKDIGAKFLKLDGSVSTSNRKEIISSFNDINSQFKILLLSLTAGGVGLNLVGANHLFLVDIHWNPQLENQAQDRIYRMGQKKNVFIYKFITKDTIEERIKQLQENKLAISESLMTGSRQIINSKLSLQDLKMLFNM
ncbi:hypothetical protein WA026_006091 [Henosepilachna vigintioctopunctata]|uniref:Transcription termination factor 2 n=1 Tax=Henosepilachna vigintioctopunctata TaxID=420089 RepID=A0AAW1TNS7_9CUCU